MDRTGNKNLNAKDAEVLAKDTEIMHENEISKINFNVEHLRDGIKRVVNGL